MGELIRAKDWAATPLGPPEAWPAELRTVVRIMLTTRHPVFILWGQEMTCLYNDAYSRSLGPEKHPGILGTPGREAWAEIWHLVGADMEAVLAGGPAVAYENQLVPITRHGQLQDVYWTYSYSPIDEGSAPNGVGGVLILCTETTGLVQAEQRRQAEAEEALGRLQEVQHRVKNNIAAIIAMVNLEARSVKDEHAREPLLRTRSRLTTFATLYELMLGAHNESSIDAGQYVRQLCETMAEMYKDTQPCQIALDVEADGGELPSERAFHLGALIVELLSNAFNHAFAGRRDGRMAVRYRHHPEAMTLIVEDDGIGIGASRSAPNSTGIGAKLVEHYARQLGGELEVHTGTAGTRYELHCPARQDEA